MTQIQEIEIEVVEEFSWFDDWMDRYAHLIEQGDALPPLSEAYKNDTYRINGCVSQVWLHAELQGEVIHFEADSDSKLTKGIIALLLRVLNDQKPNNIVQANLDFINQIGLREHLSPNRANGLSAMIKQIKLYAIGWSNNIK